jgi:glycosyltransferase involved in cell wall biosynthesis
VKRILYISPAANLGGAERCLLETLKCLDREKFDPAVLLLEDGPLRAEIKPHATKVIFLPLPQILSRAGDHAGDLIGKIRMLFCLFFFVRKLRKMLVSLQPDILHANGIKAQLLCSLSKPRGTQLVWHIHDYTSLRGTSSNLLAKQASKCDLAICNSKSVEADFNEVCPTVLTSIVYNAFHVGDVAPEPPNRLVCISLVGTYAKWKGHQLFLDAISGRQDEFRKRGLVFRVIGGPVYLTSGSQVSLDELESISSREGIDDLVEFHDFATDLDVVYAKVDILVNASIQPEPFGRTLIEAMSYGKVVIAPDTGGPLEIIEDGVTGFHFQSGNAESLAETILRAIDHPHIPDMITAAHRSIREQFSHEALRKRMSEVYSQLTFG